MQFAFEDFELDVDRLELRRSGDVVAVEPQVFDLLAFLVQHHDRAVSRDELIAHIWPERLISDAALSSRLMAARKAIGDAGREQRLIRTIHGRGFRFVGEVKTLAPVSVGSPGSLEVASPDGPNPTGDVSPPMIQYATAQDGASIAYCITGEGTPLVRVLGWFTHLEREFQWEMGRRFWDRLGANHTLVRYDGRGMGLSDPIEKFSSETRLHDLEAVIEAAGLDRFALLGMSEGVFTAINYAALHPERVTHLICYGFGPAADEAERLEYQKHWKMLFPVIRIGWGRDLIIYRRLFAQLFLGTEARQSDIEYFVEMQRASTTPDRAVHYLASINDDKVPGWASAITVPALVIHRRDDLLIPFARGRRLASLIPAQDSSRWKGRITGCCLTTRARQYLSRWWRTSSPSEQGPGLASR